MVESIQFINKEAFIGDEELFSRTVRKLLSESNIVRGKDDSSRKLYMFAVRPENLQKINEYLNLIRFRAVTDNDGVIYLTEYSSNEEYHYGREKLGRHTTLLLYIFGILYEEKSKSSTKENLPASLPEVVEVMERLGWNELFANLNAYKLSEYLKPLVKYSLITIEGTVRKENLRSDDFGFIMYRSLKHMFLKERLQDIIAGKGKPVADSDEEDPEIETPDDDDNGTEEE